MEEPQGASAPPRDYQTKRGSGAATAANSRERQAAFLQRQVSDQPWLVKAMGNPIVMGALGVVASRMLKKGMR